ncbi:MAG: acyl-CoA thioesterase [Candidatus Marinimicrobia bacterium]|nr:acyl-CoA thioesterase [Candidatus Neomarinimicrobiota bacterium]
MIDVPVSTSKVHMQEMILPNDSNILGNVLGGKVMHLMDVCAAMSALKHCRNQVVTASVDNLDFLAPSKIGDFLILKSSVNYCGTTSMEVGVRIDTENRKTGKLKHTASAYLTFVAIDEDGNTVKVPQVCPNTDDEIRRFSEAKIRYNERKLKL